MSVADDILDTHALVITLLMVEGITVQICTRCSYRYETDPRPEHKRERHYWCGREVPGPIPCVAHDWPAFWRSLPPREMLEAAKAMPKIAGPWTPDASGKYAHRSTTDDAWVCTHDVERDYVQMHAFWDGSRDEYPDRASADAALRAADWILVDEEGAT